MLPSAAELVARYLKANGYTETLASFLKEAGLPSDTGSTSNDGVSVEQILQEKKIFDMSLSFEKIGIDDKNRGWCEPSPTVPSVMDQLPTKSNILSVHTVELMLPNSNRSTLCIAATTADRRINVIDPTSSSLPLLHSFDHIQDSPVLDLIVLQRRYMLATSMSGRLVLYDPDADKVLGERRDHKKYVVKLATWSYASKIFVASAGWDSKVYLYQLAIKEGENPKLEPPFASLTLPTLPETILFIESPETRSPLLLLARRDSTFLYYYDIPEPTENNVDIPYLGKQNIAPQSNAWVAFTPSDVQVCPSDPSLVAVATSSTPHMKLLVVRLLIPPKGAPSASGEVLHTLDNSANSVLSRNQYPTSNATQAAQLRAELVVQDREDAAILININTMAPQTAYSTPRLAWRPNGSGIYVSSDDGIVRGFEASTGKLNASLRAHEPGSKIRCLVTGLENDEEFLVTGGFDTRLIVWKSQ
ncbi:WD40-repeat-containing domain protein [Lophiotrema nucula]|uniref:WD40-repeat-containing domain protein n=1 Tax=Lophiotrema nucula TaxID=690887 RepID=A0A6A5YSE8_9PLEO|nr:WD40-repeat-containing domain protein [Lophiotrema nucula]